MSETRPLAMNDLPAACLHARLLMLIVCTCAELTVNDTNDGLLA